MNSQHVWNKKRKKKNINGLSSDGGAPYLPSQARLWFVGFVEYADVVGKFERSGIFFEHFYNFSTS